MSGAFVTFQGLNYEPAGPGVARRRFGFACPKVKGRRCEGLRIRTREDSRPSWIWDGSPRGPTFTPSINCGHCGWHGYIKAGRCVDVQGADEPEPV